MEGLQQRLGRRLGLTPYYTITERSPARLCLESRPEANRAPGRRMLAGGVALVAFAALIAFSGLYAAGTGFGFGAAALGAAVGGLIGALGYQRALGGYAVSTTRNRIVADAAAGHLLFTQGNKVAPERAQRLPFDALVALRLRRRPYISGSIIRRTRPVVALELVASGDQLWIVDSAEDAELLRAAAEGLSEVLGLDLGEGVKG